MKPGRELLLWGVPILAFVLLVVVPVLLVKFRIGSRIKRFLLFCSGAKRAALEESADTEDSNYVGLGSAVLITACVAGASMLTATVVSLHHPWYAMLPVAVLYGLVIFAIDRFLVSLQLNPYRFPSDIDLSHGGVRHSAFRAAVRTLAAAVPRLAFAVLIGFLIAEPILLVLFQPEINTRVTAMQAKLASDASQRASDRYDAQIAQLSQPVAGADDLTQNRSDLETVQGEIDDQQAKLDDKKRLHDSECKGEGIKTAHGTSTTKVGCGPKAAQAQADADAAAGTLAALKAKQERLQARNRQLEQDVGTKEKRRLDDLARTKAKRDAARTKESTQAQGTSGLLIRIYALEQLATDPEPYSPLPLDERDGTSPSTKPTPKSPATPAPKSSPKPAPKSSPKPAPKNTATPAPTSGPAAVAFTPDVVASAGATTAAAAPTPVPSVEGQPVAATTAAAPGLFGLTILGKVVWIVRLWLVLLDAMPVLFKVILSTRRSRPYDVVVARLEENVIEDQSLKLARDRNSREEELRKVLIDRAKRRNEVYVPPGSPTPPPHGPVSIQVQVEGRTYRVPTQTWLRVSSSPSARIRVSDPNVNREVRFDPNGSGYSARWREHEDVVDVRDHGAHPKPGDDAEDRSA
jgi:hypothetical protein